MMEYLNLVLTIILYNERYASNQDIHDALGLQNESIKVEYLPIKL